MITFKTYELRIKSNQQLKELLFNFKIALSQLKVQQAQTPSLSKIRVVRKNIARVIIVMNEHNRAVINQFYNGKKYLSKDQKAKQSTSVKNKLNRFKAARTTEREKRRIATFPETSGYFLNNINPFDIDLYSN
ncbi:large ribosomal subunit protein uL29B [Monosporozyma servazzii]